MRLCPAVVAFALAVPGLAAAEINMAESLEWITADSDRVVRGKVVATGKDTVTIAVSETLKGPKMARVVLPAWKPPAGELLLFLVDDGGKVTLRPRDRSVIALDATRPGPAYTADFGVLDRRDDILGAVRVASRSKATASHRVDAPYDSPAFQSLWGGSSVWMTLPVDAHLEALALRWLVSDSVNTREEAVGALAHFRSPKNIALVEALLADPGFATVTEEGKAPIRRYLVRQRAHQVLDTWGVAHARPVIDEPAPLPRRGG